MAPAESAPASTPSSSGTLSAPGPRIVVPESEARAILSAWTARLDADADNAITTLDLSCRSWTVPALLILEPALVRIAPTVTHLKLDDVIASLPTAEGFATLAFFNRIFAPAPAPHVTRVDLSDNALGTRSLDVIPNLLENAPRLCHLSLHNCGMSLEVAEQLSARLGGGDDSASESTDADANASAGIAGQLRSLRLGRNQMGPEGAAAFGRLLSRCRSLRRLSYAGSRALGPGTRALLDGLVTMAASRPGGRTALVELDLDDCSFGTGADADADALGPLCALIRSSPRLAKLVLKDGGLGPGADGFDLLVAALVAGNCPLRYLDVGCLDLEADGAAALAAYIGQHLTGTLVELHLETNLIEDGGLRTLLPVLAKCKKLKVLNLTENGLEEEGYRALAATRIPGLRKLLMKENGEEDVADEVKDAIRGLYPVVLMADDDEEDATAGAADDDNDDEDDAGDDDEDDAGDGEETPAAGGAADDALAGAMGGLRI